jgi:hypothetical protein
MDPFFDVSFEEANLLQIRKEEAFRDAKTKKSAQALEEIQITWKGLQRMLCFRTRKGRPQTVKFTSLKGHGRTRNYQYIDNEQKEQSTILSLRKQRKVVPDQE